MPGRGYPPDSRSGILALSSACLVCAVEEAPRIEKQVAVIQWDPVHYIGLTASPAASALPGVIKPPRPP